MPKIDAAVLPDLPTAPDNMKTAFSYVDPQFWADKGEELRERFNAWLLSKTDGTREGRIRSSPLRGRDWP